MVNQKQTQNNKTTTTKRTTEKHKATCI